MNSALEPEQGTEPYRILDFRPRIWALGHRQSISSFECLGNLTTPVFIINAKYTFEMAKVVNLCSTLSKSVFNALNWIVKNQRGKLNFNSRI